MQRTSPPTDKPWFILREEFGDSPAYLANKYNTLTEIFGLYPDTPRQHTSRYLRVPEELEYIERVVPLWHRRGCTIYASLYYEPWFRLIRPLLEKIEAGLEEVTEEVRSHI